MSILKSSALAAALALAFATTVAGAASADPLRIPVGDVSTPAGARVLEHRIEVAAARLCQPSYALVDLNGWHYCLNSVRQQALQQLSPVQQQAYAASLSTPVALATR